MQAWTPDATLEFLQGLLGLGTAVGLAILGLAIWYIACRYGLPWRDRKE